VSTCRHCRDEFVPYRCEACRSRLVSDACQECHDELKHGQIGPPPVGRPGLPDRAAAVDIKYHGENGPHD
jgi:predicted RNA-binding protein with PUA domain